MSRFTNQELNNLQKFLTNDNNNNQNIYLGQISLLLFHITGIVKPLSWNSKLKICLYQLYSLCTITILFLFISSMLIFILYSAQDADTRIETTFQFLALCNSFIKMICIFLQNKTTIQLINLFTNKHCQPRDKYESEIIQQSSHYSRLCTLIYLTVTNLCGMTFFMFSPSTKNNVQLPFNIWTPYGLNSKSLYLLTSLFEGLGLQIGICVTCSVESLALVIILQICAQYDIFIYRLNFLSQQAKKNSQQISTYQNEYKIVKDCVKHHIHIFEIGTKLNELFSFIVFAQFLASMSMLGATIFQLSKLSSLDSQSYGLFSVFFNSLIQIFFYSFFGEKIRTKSLEIIEKIYEIKWLTITNKTGKDLIFIMTRASRPIKFMGLKMVVMSYQTFFQIVKSAYGAYNLLKGV